MKFSPVFYLMILIVCLFTPSYAQTTKEPEKSKEQVALEEQTYKLLAEIANETALLKLAENRALVSGIVGNLLWEKDEKLARRIFSSAVAELIQAQNNPKKRFQLNDEDFSYGSYYIIRNLRLQVVRNILPRDEKLALDAFYATRPAQIEDAVRAYRQFALQTGKNPIFADFKQSEWTKLEQATSEIQQEQSLKKEVAKNDPQMMAEILRETIKGGTDFRNILPDVDNLNKKDHDAAQKILGEFISKLSDEDYLPEVKSYVAYLLYNKALDAKKKSSPQPDDKNKELEFDEKQIKAIAGKALDRLLTSTEFLPEKLFAERVMYIKKVIPERAAELQPKLDKIKNGGGWIEEMETTDKLGDNPTIGQIVKNSETLSQAARSNFYNNAINKLSETETPEKVEQALKKIPDEKDREKALDYLKTLTVTKSKDKNSDGARKAALGIKNESDKIAALVNLAIAFHQKRTEESQKTAEDLMTEAATFVNQTPETETDFEKLKPFIEGYATVKPEKVFDIIAPIIEKSNELINAYVVLTNYHNKNYPYVEENEIIFGAQDSYSSFSGLYKNLAGKMATSDFQRTNYLIRTFQRADVRIAAKLIVAQSILAK
jgi:hypothetical protein